MEHPPSSACSACSAPLSPPESPQWHRPRALHSASRGGCCPRCAWRVQVQRSQKTEVFRGVHGKNMEQMGFYMILWGLNMACNGIVMRLNGNFMRKVRKNTGKLMFHWEKNMDEVMRHHKSLDFYAFCL